MIKKKKTCAPCHGIKNLKWVAVPFYPFTSSGLKSKAQPIRHRGRTAFNCGTPQWSHIKTLQPKVGTYSPSTLVHHKFYRIWKIYNQLSSFNAIIRDWDNMMEYDGYDFSPRQCHDYMVSVALLPLAPWDADKSKLGGSVWTPYMDSHKISRQVDKSWILDPYLLVKWT